MSNKLKVFEAFSGIGSQSMALRNLGINYEVVGISEIDRYGLVCYSAIHKNLIDDIDKKTDEYMYEYLSKKRVGINFSTNKNELPKKGDKLRQIYIADIKSNNLGDITLINEKDIPDHDFFTYSFPCKNISVEGKQDGFSEGGDTKSSLVWECKRIISLKKPKYMMMENVKNIVSYRHKPDFDKWCYWLNEQGYENYWAIYNSNSFGVPQNRERVIMMSVLKEYAKDIGFQCPLGNVNTKIKLLDILDNSNIEEYIIDKDYLEGFVEIIDSEKLENLSNNILSEFILYTNKEDEKDILNRCKHMPLYTSLDNVKLIVREATSLGYKIANVGDSINLNQKNSKTRRGRVGNNEAKTLDTSCNQAIVMCDYRLKKLSPIECWRLQGFKDEDFYKCNTVGIPVSKLYERAGRGITVPMLEEIFKNMFKEYIDVKEVN